MKIKEWKQVCISFEFGINSYQDSIDQVKKLMRKYKGRRYLRGVSGKIDMYVDISDKNISHFIAAVKELKLPNCEIIVDDPKDYV